MLAGVDKLSGDEVGGGVLIPVEGSFNRRRRASNML